MLETSGHLISTLVTTLLRGSDHLCLENFCAYVPRGFSTIGWCVCIFFNVLYSTTEKPLGTKTHKFSAHRILPWTVVWTPLPLLLHSFPLSIGHFAQNTNYYQKRLFWIGVLNSSIRKRNAIRNTANALFDQSNFFLQMIFFLLFLDLLFGVYNCTISTTKIS